MTAIFVREVRSAFSGMMGWLLTAFLVAASGLYFMANNLGFVLTDFGYYTLYQTSFVLLVYVPVLAMRSLAGERHARTDQLLLTSPVPAWGIVLGKYLAMCAVFALPCLADAAMILALRLLGSTGTALASNFASLLGYYLLGCAAIALCEWISGLTENQIVAAVLGFCGPAAGLPDAQPAQPVQRRSAAALVIFTLLAAAASVLAGLRSRSLTLGCVLFAVAGGGDLGAVPVPQRVADRGFQRGAGGAVACLRPLSGSSTAVFRCRRWSITSARRGCSCSLRRRGSKSAAGSDRGCRK